MDKATFYLLIVWAVYCSHMLLWFISQAAEKHLSLYDLYQFFRRRYPEYTYLVLVHEFALKLYQRGISKEDVAKSLENDCCSILFSPVSSPDLVSAVEYVKRVLLKRLLINIYLVNNSFSFSDYQKLRRDMERLEDQEPLIQLSAMLIIKIPDLQKLMQLGAIIAQCQSPPYLGAVVSGDDVSKGKNQSLLFEAMKGILINEKTPQIAFVIMLQGLKTLFPSIQPVTSPAMSQNKIGTTDNESIMMIREEIQKRIAELSIRV